MPLRFSPSAAAPTTPPLPTGPTVPTGQTGPAAPAQPTDPAPSLLTVSTFSTCPVDGFDAAPPKGTQLDGTPTAAPTGVLRGGLPDVLLSSPRAVVRHGDDPGDFYCEHAFFTAQSAANAPGSSVLKNAAGERLVGFLHVPRDAAADTAAPVADQATRHSGTREVIGAALRGYVDEAQRAGAEPTRVLLTGYGAWSSILNNPTGDFVSHRDNVDAAMRQAFGRQLVTAHGRRVGGDANADTWSYRVRDPATGRQREVQVQARRLPVADDAINGSKQSLQTAIATFRPHGVSSMGVHGGSDFLAEHRADDGGLRVDQNGKQVHDDQQAQTQQLPDNYALPRAIERGARPPAVSVNDLGLSSIDRSLQAFAGRRASRVT